MSAYSLSELSGLDEDPAPQIPDPPPPPYSKPPEFPHGKPWVLSEDEWERYAEAGYPDEMSGL